MGASLQIASARLREKYAGNTGSLTGKYINGWFGEEAAENFIRDRALRDCIDQVRNERGAISREECLKYISP